MARTARKLCNSNIYHIILRGINRRTIFENEDDYNSFIYCLRFYKSECKYQVLAYCLMHNHIHLLLYFDSAGDNISMSMKKMEDKFIFWYNKKYDRSGHLFQNRFKSEPVEDEKYLLKVFRYIHQNPIKAGLMTDLSLYKWSSFSAYKKKKSSIVDVNFMKQYFESWGELINYLSQANNDYCMEYISIRTSDDYAISVIKEITQCENLSKIDSLPMDLRDTYIAQFASLGMSLRQISRLTGISKPVIDKAVQFMK